MLKNTPTHYGAVAKIFHWLIFLLVVGMLSVGYLMDGLTDKALRGSVYNLHKLTGLLVLMLMVLRLLWALMNPKPVLPLDTPKWQHAAERIGHFSLYFLLLAMPMCGWVGAVAAGHAPHLFQWELSLPIAPDKALDHLAFSLHATIAIVIIIFVSLHVLAALYHHFIKKDNILRRMMP